MKDNLPSIIDNTDLTPLELEKVNKFIEAGLPGVAQVKDATLYRMLDLYMGGSTYTQISSILEIKKVIVLYFAHTANWYETRKEYINEIQEKIKNRVVDAKLRNKEFMLLLVQAWQKKVGTKLTKYLSTNDDSHMEKIDLKEIAQLMRAIDMVNELDSYGKNQQGKTPAVGLNLGDGVIVERTGDNSVSITPKKESSTVGDMLQQLADNRRQQEKTIPTETSDIIQNTQGENDETK